MKWLVDLKTYTPVSIPRTYQYLQIILIKYSIPRTYSRNFLVCWPGCSWATEVTGEVDLKVRNAPPSFRSDIGTFPFDPSPDPQINLWRIFFIIFRSFFLFYGQCLLSDCWFHPGYKTWEIEQNTRKNRPLMQNLVFNPGIQMAESTVSLELILDWWKSEQIQIAGSGLIWEGGEKKWLVSRRDMLAKLLTQTRCLLGRGWF